MPAFYRCLRFTRGEWVKAKEFKKITGLNQKQMDYRVKIEELPKRTEKGRHPEYDLAAYKKIKA